MLTNTENPTPRLVALAAGILAFWIALCANAAAGDDVWYTVELIAFEQLDERGLDEERWPGEPGQPDLSEAIELTGEWLSDPGDEPGISATPHAFQLLPQEAFQLTDAWKALRRSRPFRPVLHIAWRQPGYSKDEARALHVSTRLPDAPDAEVSGVPGAQPDAGINAALEAQPDPGSMLPPAEPAVEPPPIIDGTVRLYRARYLHLGADLLYYRPNDEQALTTGTAGGQSAPGEPVPVAGEVLQETRTPTLFRMRTTRRMRSRKLHYLDHPLFGVLVLVTPYDLPAAPPADAPAPPPANASSVDTPTPAGATAGGAQTQSQ